MQLKQLLFSFTIVNKCMQELVQFLTAHYSLRYDWFKSGAKGANFSLCAIFYATTIYLENHFRITINLHRILVDKVFVIILRSLCFANDYWTNFMTNTQTGALSSMYSVTGQLRLKYLTWSLPRWAHSHNMQWHTQSRQWSITYVMINSTQFISLELIELHGHLPFLPILTTISGRIEAPT